MLSVATILLAAGSSSRLGRPKQLLPYRGSTLLRHAAETALAADLGPVIVVIGAVEEECRATLSGLPLTIVANAAWPEGMGRSIAAAMESVNEAVHRAVIIMPCDQPAVTSNRLRSLEEHQRMTGKSIVASQYNSTLGPPALFTAQHFPELRLLRGPQGAKSLFQSQANLGFVDCPEAEWDIDTDEDLMRVDSVQ